MNYCCLDSGIAHLQWELRHFVGGRSIPSYLFSHVGTDIISTVLAAINKIDYGTHYIGASFPGSRPRQHQLQGENRLGSNHNTCYGRPVQLRFVFQVSAIYADQISMPKVANQHLPRANPRSSSWVTSLAATVMFSSRKLVTQSRKPPPIPLPHRPEIDMAGHRSLDL
jgi:hypothetical protein